MAAERIGPLTGVKVVEIGVWVAGPAAAGILADWGAEVIKIEPIGGDPARIFSKMLGGDMPTNPVFEMDNRSKRSIAVDLSCSEGQQIAERLIDGADVLVTNVRLAGLERIGLDPDSVAERHPRLICAAITGYGQQGPEADSAAYDIAAFWARSGIAHLLTAPDGEPPFQRGGMGDHNAGLAAAAAVCAALFDRERTGEGQVVSTSLFREGIYTISFDLSVALGWGLTLQIGRRTSMANPAMNNYTSGDGRRFWVVGLEGERHWPPLARAVGHPEWLTDERFADPRSRARNAEMLIGMLDEAFAARTMEQWEEAFAAEPDLFWAPIQSPEELLADPQFAASGALIDVPDGAGTTTMVATPVDFHGTPWAATAPAPGLGEHTREILAEIGRHDVDSLLEAGVVGEPAPV